MSRPAGGIYPARMVLLDISPPFNMMIGRSLIDALENFIGLSSSLAGLTRIPLLGMYVLTSFPEMVLPLTNVKGNSIRLFKALQEMRNLMDDYCHQGKENGSGLSLSHGLIESCRQFQRYIGNIQQSSSFDQLEIIVLTAHRGNIVQQHLKDLPSQVDLGLLKRILCVTVQCEGMEAGSEPDERGDEGEDCSGLVDILTVDCDPVSLQRLFHGWLSDSLTAQEHLHVLLPPPCPADPPLCVKCDLVDMMISPAQLPFTARYDLSVDASIVKVVYPTPSKATGMTVPVHRLQTISSLPRGRVCESVLFGPPLMALPTTCWTTDWEELERNQAKFNTLCDELVKKDQVLLVQVMIPPVSPHPKGGTLTTQIKATATPPPPSGYFILMPSGNRSLLVKGAVPSELLLPNGRPRSTKPSGTEDELAVLAALSQVPARESFNPLNFNSGLFESLKHSCTPKSALAKGWGVKRSEPKKITQQQQPPSVPPPPSKPGHRLTANAWSNPLRSVVNKAHKAPPTPTRHGADAGGFGHTNNANNKTKIIWKSGFSED